MKPVAFDIPLDRTACLHRQVLEGLRQRILKREILPGALLPSTRALAQRLHVSRNTVLIAYEELATEGLITGQIGSGTRVSGHVPLPRLPSPREILRASHFPMSSVPFFDPEGNPLRLQ